MEELGSKPLTFEHSLTPPAYCFQTSRTERLQFREVASFCAALPAGGQKLVASMPRTLLGLSHPLPPKIHLYLHN